MTTNFSYIADAATCGMQDAEVDNHKIKMVYARCLHHATSEMPGAGFFQLLAQPENNVRDAQRIQVGKCSLTKH
jgi:hypothetical protein